VSAPNAGESTSDGRLRALRMVLGVVPADAHPAFDVAELCALAEWVETGSIDAVTAVVGHTQALYGRKDAA
jgi:hypothetical protein